MQTNILPQDTPLSPADKKLEGEIDSAVAKINAYQAKKMDHLNEYAQVKAETEMGKCSEKELRFSRQELLKELEEIDSSISSERDKSLRKCEEFSNKAFAETYLEFRIHDASVETRQLQEKIKKLRLLAHTPSGYVEPDYNL